MYVYEYIYTWSISDVRVRSGNEEPNTQKHTGAQLGGANHDGGGGAYTACSLPVILKNSCSELHCQKGSDSIPFSYKITGGELDRVSDNDGGGAVSLLAR